MIATTTTTTTAPAAPAAPAETTLTPAPTQTPTQTQKNRRVADTKCPCPICASDRPRGQCITCPSCQFLACRTCYKTYAEPFCMNCRAEFTRQFLVANLGKTYVDGVFKEKALKRLLERETRLLPAAQPFADWERRCREERDQARFGRRVAAGPRPDYHRVIRDDFYPCPVANCRGFVEVAAQVDHAHHACGVCQTLICWACREPAGPAGTDNHVCNPDTLASMARIRQDSRPCPRCGVAIHRDHGCDHMRCTHCRTHWNWATGAIMRTSTNHHYDHVQQFAENVAVRATTTPAAPDDARPGCDANPYVDAVPMTAVQLQHAHLPADLLRALYGDVRDVRYAKTHLFDERRLEADRAEALLKLRVRYLLQEITQAQWLARVFTIDAQHDRDQHYAQVLSLYLGAVRDLQEQLAQTGDADGVRTRLNTLVRLCNDSFASLHEQYGGKHLTISISSDEHHAPGTPAITVA